MTTENCCKCGCGRVPSNSRYYIVGHTPKVWTYDLIRLNVTVDEATGCWNWLLGKTTAGYGVIRQGADSIFVHRFVFGLFGILANGNVVRHACDNPACCNPGHLLQGTQKDNMRDAANRGRIRVPGLHSQDHPRTRLTKQQALEIKYSKGPLKITAAEYGIDFTTVSKIRLGHLWKYLGAEA